jgi:hypothetical protein
MESVEIAGLDHFRSRVPKCFQHPCGSPVCKGYSYGAGSWCSCGHSRQGRTFRGSLLKYVVHKSTKWLWSMLIVLAYRLFVSLAMLNSGFYLPGPFTCLETKSEVVCSGEFWQFLHYVHERSFEKQDVAPLFICANYCTLITLLRLLKFASIFIQYFIFKLCIRRVK